MMLRELGSRMASMSDFLADLPHWKKFESFDCLKLMILKHLGNITKLLPIQLKSLFFAKRQKSSNIHCFYSVLTKILAI